MKTTKAERDEVRAELTKYGPKLCLVPNAFVLKLLDDLDEYKAKVESILGGLHQA